MIEGFVECLRGFLVVPEQPVLALRVGAGEVLQASVEHRPFRVPAAGDFDDVTGVRAACRTLFEGGDEGGGIDIPVADRVFDSGRRRHELRLPADEVLAVRDVAPARIAVEGVILSDVGEQLPCIGVVEAEPPDVQLAERLVVLAPLVHVEPVARIDEKAGDARPRRGAHERNVARPLRHGEEVGQAHQVAQENLQPAVGKRGVEEISLLAAGRPQFLVDLDFEQHVRRTRVHLDPLDAAELGPELEGIPDDRFNLVVELLSRREGRGIEIGSEEIVQRRKGVDCMVFIHAPHPSAAVQRPGFIVLEGSGGDGERVLARSVGHGKEGGLQPHRRRTHRRVLQELDLLDVDGVPGERLQQEFDVSGGRNDRGPVDAVVGQPGEVLLGEPRLEQDVVAGHAVSDEGAVGVLAALDEHLVVDQVVIARGLFPGMAGKEMGDGFRTRILRGEIQRDAGPVEVPQGLLKARARILILHQGRETDRGRAGRLQTLPDQGLQRAMRGDLQNHVGAAFPPHGLHRRAEEDGVPDVGPPVGVVQTLHGLPRDGGHHGHVAVEVAFVQEGERLQRVVPQGIHRGGMEGDVPGDQPVLQAAPVEFRHHGPQRGFLPADDGVGGRVLAGDLRLGGPVVSQQILDGRPVEADRQHPAGAGHPLLQRGPVIDEPRRIGE